MAECAACDEQAVTFIKGLWLCRGHLLQATARAGAADGKAAVATGRAIMATLTDKPASMEAR